MWVTTENTEHTEFHGKKHGIPLRLRKKRKDEGNGKMRSYVDTFSCVSLDVRWVTTVRKPKDMGSIVRGFD